MPGKVIKAIFLLSGLILITVGLLASIKTTQPIFYHLSSDGIVGAGAKGIIRLVGYVCIAGGVLLIWAVLKIKSLVYWFASLPSIIQSPARNKWLLSIFFIALVLRVMWVLSIPTVQFSDFAVYDEMGTSLARGVPITSEKITAIYPPGYPLFLAAHYKIAGHNQLLVKISQALIGSVLCVLVYFLIKEIASEIVARIASIITAIFPTLIFTTSLLASENIFTPIFILALYLFIRAYKDKSLLYSGISGILFGMACLIRYGIYALPVLLIAWLLFQKKTPLSRKLSQSAVLLVCFVCVIFPWQWRNKHVFGAWGIMGTNLGWTFYATNTDYDYADKIALVNSLIDSGKNEYEVSREMLKRGIEAVKQQPGFFLKNLIVGKVRYFFFGTSEWLSQYNLNKIPWDQKFKNIIYHLILATSSFGYYITFFLFIIGLLFYRSSGRFNSLFLVIIGYNILLLIISKGLPRYRHSLLPIYIYYASLAITVFLKKISSPKYRAEETYY